MQRSVKWIILVLLFLSIKIFSLFPDAVEHYYSQGFYPYMALFQRTLFGWLPFSIGDLLYLFAGIWLLRLLIKFINRIRKGKLEKGWWKYAARSFAFVVLLLYIIFNIFWGLNYNRRGIAHQLSLLKDSVAKKDIINVMNILATKVNALDSSAKNVRHELRSKQYLFSGAISSYVNLHKHRPWISYSQPSLKPSLFSYLGNYMGYTGYYNPFTGEAQVNTTVPTFVQPFTACHEIGHQLGYAKENEANFAGFLSARTSKDPAFLYSVYFELYSYGRPFLYYADSMALKRCDSLLNPGVKKDFKELRSFYERHANPIEVVIDKLYGNYLKANEQPDGKMTYNKVILWLAVYFKKYGEI